MFIYVLCTLKPVLSGLYIHVGSACRAGHRAVRMILVTWCEYVEERVSCKEVQFTKFCPPVNTILILSSYMHA